MPRLPCSAAMLPIEPLDRTMGKLGQQLAASLRQAIRSGELKTGELLPSSRQLAASMGLSRGTVTEAFEQLIAEGFLEAQHRGGTRVAKVLAEMPAPMPIEAQTDTLSGRAAEFERIAKQITYLPPVPFSVSVPTGLASPGEIWRKLGNRIRAQSTGAPTGYDDPQGVLSLREAIAGYIRRSRAVQCSADQVIITSGTQQGLFLACQVLLDDTDVAWIEDPAYWGITGILETMRRMDRVARIRVDSAGIDVAHGIQTAPDARVAFVTPSHQYPLGMPMSMGRRNELVTWAQTHKAWIVEDDYDSELRYAGHPFPALQGLAPDRVVYLGTFSKVLYPSLRLGYIVAPKMLVNAFCGARMLMDRHSPSTEQHVLAAYIHEGHFERHIRRIRHLYAERRQQLIGLIHSMIPSHLAWLQPSDQGMHLLLWFAEGIDDQSVVKQAMLAGISLRAVSPMFAGENGRPGVILGLGGFDIAAMQAGIQYLNQLLIEHSQAANHTPAA